MSVQAHLRSEPAGELPQGEFPFTREDFNKIAALLREDSGIHLPENKTTLVYSRLAKRVRALRLGSFHEYCTLVAGHEGKEERRHMLAALTTNVTRFFREPHHFDHLAKNVLPPLIEEARAGGKVRIWSAGCSTGQEPYSLGLTVLSMLPQAADMDVRILASDIDPVVVATAREGVYSEESVVPIPADMRRRWLRQDGQNGWAVGPELRRLVAFRELNLMGAWPMKGRFQAVFCRNVVIYFDDATQARLWDRFADALAPAGRLYVGHSERVTSSRFDPDGLTSFRLKRGAA